jgi:hypothetical protein
MLEQPLGTGSPGCRTGRPKPARFIRATSNYAARRSSLTFGQGSGAKFA